MISEDKKDTQTESTAVSVLDNLKTSNLPEIIGWKEKQEKLVEDNPYLEIVDTKTYDEACKRRTALLKGRTELKSQDTKIASKLSTFRKEVGTETAALIAITQPHEEKQDAEVKRWESVKAKEKEEKANAEANRVKAIQDKLESVETEAYKIIQPMLFSEIEAKSKEVEVLLKADGFDFEEYDAVLDQVVSRVESALYLKINNLTEQENQRVENEKLKKEQEASKAKEELQNKRLQEILPYIAFGEPIDATKLHEISEEQYQLILSNKKGLHETKAKADAKLEEERLAKEKEEKEAVFDIRKNRLLELGFIFNDKFYYDDENITISLLHYTIYNLDTIGFENKITEIKADILTAKQKAEEIKIQKEADEKAAKEDAARLKKQNAERIKKFAKDKKSLTEFLESLYFRIAVPEMENKEMEEILNVMVTQVNTFISESVEIVNKY